MAVIDFWEIDPNDTASVWRKLIGHDQEDISQTAAEVAVILDGIPSGNRCLEIGAGVGRLLKHIHAAYPSRFRELLGVDSSVSLSLASQSYLRDTGIQVLLTGGLSLPFSDAQFDFAFSYTCLQHQISLALVNRILAETCRVLVPGGLCRMQTVLAKPETDPRDLAMYDGRVMRDPAEFGKMAADAGLDEVKLDIGLTHPEHVWLTGRKP